MSTNRWLEWARWTLIVLTVSGLAIDTFVHFDLASTYDPIRTSTLSQGDLFRVEAVLAAVAAIALLVRPRRYTSALALVVAGSGAAALIIYRYYDIGKIGPIPSMYEPLWFPEKTTAAIAESAATVTALAGLVIEHLRVRRPEARTEAVPVS